MKDLRDIDYEQYVRKEIPGYIEVDDELTHIRTTLSASENIIQYGPQGIGKTLSYEHVAAKEGVPIIQLDCSKDTKRSHLVAQTTFSIDKDGNKKVEFIPGAIPKSIIAANQYGKAMLILEEINALSPALQKMLNQISDHRQAIEVSEAGGMVGLNKDSNLMVGGTMNPSGTFGGTFDLNRDLRSRFNELQREFPNNRKLREILKVQNVPEKVGDQSNVIPQISSFVESVHSLVEKGKVSYEFSPRDAVRLGKMWDQYYEVLLEVNDKGMNESRESLRMALQTSVMGKFREEEEKQLIGEQISDCFAVQSY